jgi:hypothetical protein
MVCSRTGFLAIVACVATAIVPATVSAQPFPWPLKPFARQHPVRGNFGDPRTKFRGPPSQKSIMRAGGSFSFHSGIDIVAAPGQPVYPVRTGIVRIVSGNEVAVDSPDGVSFVYWHIRPAVANGTEARAQQTVLGHVLKQAGHLHFGEFEGGAFVNPLAAGHLRPYVDALRPRVRGITLRQASSGVELSPLSVHGRVRILADAYDQPSPSVTGVWAGLPVAPAIVAWRLERLSGQIAIPETTAIDFRGPLLPRAQFWSVYARGTYQNMPVFGTQLGYLQPGRYVFNLTPKGLDTHHLRFGNDVYNLVVRVSDIRGNSSTLTERITVRN